MLTGRGGEDGAQQVEGLNGKVIDFMISMQISLRHTRLSILKYFLLSKRGILKIESRYAALIKLEKFEAGYFWAYLGQI